MKIIGFFFIISSTVIFCIFRFVIVKIAYFKYPVDKSWDGFWDILTAAYRDEYVNDGILHEIYGPVSGIEDYVYILHVLCVVFGCVILICKSKKQSK